MDVSIDKRKCVKCGFCTKFAKSVFAFDTDGEITVSKIDSMDEKNVKKVSLLCEANAILIKPKNKIKTTSVDKILSDSENLNEYKKSFMHLLLIFKVIFIFHIIVAILSAIYIAVVYGFINFLIYLGLGFPLGLLIGAYAYYLATNLLKFNILTCDLFNKITNKDEQDKNNNPNDLKKFKELLDAGIITQEEFEAKKKQILGS